MRFIVSLCAAILVTSGIVAGKAIDENIVLQHEIQTARTYFLAKFLPELDRRSNSKNQIISAYGIHSALTAVLAGAKGETYNQLWDVLGYKYTKLDHESMLKANQETLKNLTKLHDLGLNFANLLVVDNELQLTNEFRDSMKKNFNSEILKEDFKHDAKKGTDDINNWVKEITKGKIPKLFNEPLKANTAAVIANALHFKSSWRTKFDEKISFVGKFNLKNGETKDVTYMKISAVHLKDSRYSENFGFRNLQIPFDNEGRLWFGILLPDYSFLKGFECCSAFTYYIQETRPQAVELQFPKFNVSQTHNQLKEIFETLGVKDLFNSSSSDLSGIDNKKDLFVSDIAHKATFSVDEKGAEGAAATGAVISTRNAVIPTEHIKFIVDRPFIFTVTDKLTGVDLFTGLIYSP